jgi:phospholipid transport system transporter-binding protein
MNAQVEISEDTLLLKGDLLFSTVLSVRAALEQAVDQAQKRCIVDFAGVGRVDSSAVSLWLCLERKTRSRQLTLSAINIPDELTSIVRLVGLEHTGLNP